MIDKPCTRQPLRVDVVPEHPLFKWVYTMSRAILNKWGLANGRIYFNDSQRTPCRHQHRQGTFAPHRLWFQYPCLEQSMTDGFEEYKTFKWLWSGHSLKGLGALWATAIHELAHVLQTERGERYYGQAHNAAWASIVQDLQTEYPLGKCKDMWLRDRQDNKVRGKGIVALMDDLGQPAARVPKVTKPRKPKPVKRYNPTLAEIAEALSNLGIGQRVIVILPDHVTGKSRLLDGQAGRVISKGTKRCRVQFGKALGDKQWYIPAQYLVAD